MTVLHCRLPRTDLTTRLVICTIETLEAIAKLDEILAVDGIDVLFIGPGDLHSEWRTYRASR